MSDVGDEDAEEVAGLFGKKKKKRGGRKQKKTRKERSHSRSFPEVASTRPGNGAVLLRRRRYWTTSSRANWECSLLVKFDAGTNAEFKQTLFDAITGGDVLREAERLREQRSRSASPQRARSATRRHASDLEADTGGFDRSFPTCGRRGAET